MNTKKQFETLEKIINVFQRFDGKLVKKDGKDLKDVRKDLTDTIKKLEDGSLGWKFTRKDDTTTKRVRLWAYQNCMEHNMTPDFEIGVDENGKIWVQNDILWKTLYGLQEQMQEETAYDYKYRRG